MSTRPDNIRERSERCLGGCCKVTPFAVELVEASSSHMPWVYKSWLESYHDNGVDLRGARMGEFSALMTARMQRLVGRSHVFVAVEPDDTDHLYGGAVVEVSAANVPIVHFVYVRASRRGHGLAAALVKHAFSRLVHTAEPPEWQFTHATYLGKHVGVRRGHGGRHNAAAAWSEEPARRTA